MVEADWKSFYDESKKPYSSEEEFAKYCETFSGYIFQAPHVQECLELARNSKEFLNMISNYGELE